MVAHRAKSAAFFQSYQIYGWNLCVMVILIHFKASRWSRYATETLEKKTTPDTVVQTSLWTYAPTAFCLLALSAHSKNRFFQKLRMQTRLRPGKPRSGRIETLEFAAGASHQKKNHFKVKTRIQVVNALTNCKTLQENKRDFHVHI